MRPRDLAPDCDSNTNRQLHTDKEHRGHNGQSTKLAETSQPVGHRSEVQMREFRHHSKRNYSAAGLDSTVGRKDTCRPACPRTRQLAYMFQRRLCTKGQRATTRALTLHSLTNQEYIPWIALSLPCGMCLGSEGGRGSLVWPERGDLR
jgi:hypothetical protein